MSEFYKPQTSVDWTSNDAYPQYKLWRKEVERIIGGPLAGKSDEIKLNHVFIWAGARAEQLIEARTNESPDLTIDTPKKLLDELAACLTHETSFREAREDFYNVKQRSEENTTTFYSRIVDLHKRAEFPANSDFLIVDKLVHGCVNMECKRKLMAKGKDVSVKDCLDVLRRYESVNATMRKLAVTDQPKVSAAYSRDPTRKSQSKITTRAGTAKNTRNIKPSRSCAWCGNDRHARDDCPAKDANCRYCKNKGHFEKVCFKKQRGQQQQRAVDADLSDDCEGEYDLYAVRVSTVNNKRQPREVLTTIKFCREGSKPITRSGKVDTGAMVSCMPLSSLLSMGFSQNDITSSSVKLRGVSGADLENIGYIDILVRCNQFEDKARFYITKHGTDLILGVKFINRFQLVSYASSCILREIVTDTPSTSSNDNVNAVHIMNESEVDYTSLQHKWKEHLPLGKVTGDPLEDLKRIFPDMFDGKVGLFDGEVSLKLASDANSVQLPPRAMPHSVLPQLKKELDKMEQEGIIRACPETTDWVHNIVTVVKKNGTLRICLDPRNLNKHLIRNVHYTASWEDAIHSFKNGQYFSTLDAKSGYWTKRLNPDSQLLTAFNTPFKKYCFIRMPFGLSVSAEIFCKQMDHALQGIPGTFPCADDVKIQGSTEQRHDIHLLETVEKAKLAGLKFNPDKCSVKKHQIEYFGRIVTPDGVCPCPRKVQAITSMTAPTDKLELQSFLGSVGFVSTFIPNLSKKTHLMRGLLKKRRPFRVDQ